MFHAHSISTSRFGILLLLSELPIDEKKSGLQMIAGGVCEDSDCAKQV